MTFKTTHRGVYRLEFLSPEGFPVFMAVTADNRRIAERTCYPLDDVDEVVTSLYQLLEAEAPER